MLGSIKYNLTHLLDFKGRDARQTFWFYVLFVIALYIVAWIVAIVPLVGSVMSDAMKAAQEGLPQDEVTARITAGMGPKMGSIAWFGVVSSLLLTLLTLAAFVRRLHDSNNSGWWAGLVLLIKLATVAVSVRAIGHIDEAFQTATAAVGDPARMQQLQAAQDPAQTWATLLGWVGLIVVIVFGVMKSNDGPNRYGEAPVVF
jgi:uncharacterized membrane protein YhaH (DUF805 family)